MGRRILVTGARAPATLELIRRLARSGHEMFAADSLRFPISRGSRYLAKAFLLTSPRLAPKRYVEELASIVEARKIDFLLPTCEEIYYLARYRSILPPGCEVFSPSFELLHSLHNKWQFARQVEAVAGPVTVPHSVLVRTESELAEAVSSPEQWVLKPVYSRFAAQTLIQPSAAQLARLRFDSENPWLAQKYVSGRELSSYSIIRNGAIHAHALYHSRYRAGQASGFYFVPEENEDISRFVEDLASRLNFTGQIAFDFIKPPGAQAVVLECNPRLTSGIHLFPPHFDLGRAFWGTDGAPLRIATDAPPKMLGFAMFIYGLGYLRRGVPLRKLVSDFLSAQDVIFDRNDPFVAGYQIPSFIEILFRSQSSGVSLTEAATADIEWNGQTIE